MTRLFRNTMFASADMALLIILSLIATPCLIFGLGTAGYGVYVFLSIFSVYGALSFFDFGMEGALITHIARFEAAGENGKVGEIMSIALLYYGLIGIGLSAILYWFSGSLVERFISDQTVPNSQVMSAIGWVAINVLFQFICTPFIAVLQGLRRFALAKTINSAFNIFQYLLIMGVSIWWHRIDMVFEAIAGISVLRMVAYAFSYLRVPYYGIRVQLNQKLIWGLLRSSNTLFLNRLIGLVYNQSGKFLIGLKLPITQMAVYDVVYRPGSLIRVVVSMVYSAIIPEVARLKQMGETVKIGGLYICLIRYAYLMIMPIVVAIAAHSDKLLSLWVGSEFDRYGYLVGVMMITSSVNPLASIASTMVVGLDAVKKTVWISVVGVLVYVSLSAASIGKLGVLGLFISLSIAEIAMVLPYLVVMNRLLKLRVRDVLYPLLMIFALAAVFWGGHLLLTNLLVKASIILWTGSIITLMLIQYGVQFFALLKPAERQFMFGKLYPLRQSFAE